MSDPDPLDFIQTDEMSTPFLEKVRDRFQDILDRDDHEAAMEIVKDSRDAAARAVAIRKGIA